MPEVITHQRSSCSRRVACFPLIIMILLITQAAVGLSYIHDCEGHPFIPIYLVGFGGSILVFCCRKECSYCIAFCFFIWFIAGNVCIFLIYNDYKEGKLRCDKTLYLVAFGSTIVTYILLIAVCCACGCEEEQPNDVAV